MYYTRFNSPICEIILVGNEEGLSHLHLNTKDGKRRFEISQEWQHNSSFFNDIIKQLEQYFAGDRKSFTVKLNPKGTDFQKKIWQNLIKIPYGSVTTYGAIAQAIGKEKAARAVGMANSRNPIPLIVPCHRVIGKSGSLTGFAHGLKMKEKLLRFEGFNCK